MATKTVTTVEELPEIENDVREIETKDDALSELNVLLDELGGDDQPEISVYHQSAGGKSAMEFCFQYEPGEMSVSDALTRLREKFGAGTFRFHVRAGTPRRLVANKAFSLAAIIEKPEKESSGNFMEMMQMQMAQQQSMFSAINSAMVGMMTAQADNRPVPIDPAAQQRGMLEQMALMKEIFGGGNTKSDVDTLLQGMELAGNFGPKGDTNSSDILLKAMETFAGPVAQIMANETTQPASPEMPHPDNGQPIPQESHEQNESNKMRIIIKQQLKFLLKGAEKNTDPASYADIVVDSIGLEQLVIITKQRPLLEWLYDYLPEAQNHAEWFGELDSVLMEMIEPEPELTVPESEPVLLTVDDNDDSVPAHVLDANQSESTDAPG